MSERQTKLSAMKEGCKYDYFVLNLGFRMPTNV